MFLLSLRTDARREVKAHIASNPEFRPYRRAALGRFVDKFFRNRGILWFAAIYVFMVLTIVGLSGYLGKHLTVPSGILEGFVDGFAFLLGSSPAVETVEASISVNKVLLAVQATLLAVVLPVAIALITLMQSQEDRIYGQVTIRAYFMEAGAYEFGRSSVVLVLGTIMVIFWPFKAPLTGQEIANCNDCLAGAAVTLLNSVWLVINVFLLWHFLKTSLDFARPDIRTIFINRFQVNFSNRVWLERELTRLRYEHPDFFGLLKSEEIGKDDDSDYRISFGYSLDIGTPEVKIDIKNPSVLYDIWFRPLRWVIRRWLRKTKATSDTSGLHAVARAAVLYFPITMDRIISGDQVICRRRGGAAVSAFERWVIERCFRFKKVQA